MGGTKVHEVIPILSVSRMFLSSFSYKVSVFIRMRRLLPFQHYQSYTNTILTFKAAHNINISPIHFLTWYGNLKALG